jgi:hypothetical protein
MHEPWALLLIGSAASLAVNVAVAEPTAYERMIAAWPSFALIGAYEPPCTSSAARWLPARRAGVSSGRLHRPRLGDVAHRYHNARLGWATHG